MNQEIDLLKNYPKSKRDLDERAQNKSDQDREIARRFGKEFFDGDRKHGYGGFTYNPRFWKPVVPTFIEHWGLTKENSILDVGCAKGFMIYDFMQEIKGLHIRGIDISEYAIKNSMEEVRNCVTVGNAKNLNFEDNSFDYVSAINTIHNLNLEDCITSIKEIERVASKGAFITVDAYNTAEEMERMYKWNLTAKTIMSVSEWKDLFKQAGYSGNYYWFIP